MIFLFSFDSGIEVANPDPGTTGIDSGDLVTEADVDVLFLPELFRGAGDKFFGLPDYIADVIGLISGRVGDVRALFEEDDFELGIHPPGPAGCRSPPGDAADNQQFLFHAHSFSRTDRDNRS